MQSKRAFTMTELIIACAIITGTAFIFLNMRLTEQTAQREAERLINWFHRLTQESNRTHKGFRFKAFEAGEPNAGNIGMTWSDDDSNNKFDDIFLQASPGCKFEPQGDIKTLKYSIREDAITGGKIKVTGSDGSFCYIIFSMEGRVRISDIDVNINAEDADQ